MVGKYIEWTKDNVKRSCLFVSAEVAPKAGDNVEVLVDGRIAQLKLGGVDVTPRVVEGTTIPGEWTVWPRRSMAANQVAEYGELV